MRFVHFLLTSERIKTASLRLPRASKTKCCQLIKEIAGNKQDDEDADEEEHFSSEVEDDDVANLRTEVNQLDTPEDIGSDCEVCSDGTISDAEEWVYHDDTSEEEERDIPPVVAATDGTRWRTVAEAAGRLPARNVLSQRPGFQRGLRPQSRLEAFHAVFEKILFLGLTYTNVAGRRFARAKNAVWHAVDQIELEAFLGLHILAGALKAHHRSVRQLYDMRDGIHLFNACMSEKRFEQIKACLRFDDPLRRNKEDRAAPVKSLIELFNDKMLQIYVPGGSLTIDEMLIEFHGRVVFKQYLPCKPGKFGLKVYWVTDADNAMPLRCLLYIGKGTVCEFETESYNGHVPALVMNLMKPFLDSGRNLTADCWFTSLKLARILSDRRTTLLGPLKKNSPGLPEAAKSTEGRSRGDSVHYYAEASSITICSFWDKGAKPVNILSTMHGTQQNKSPDQGKPEIATFYNETKSGVDTLDKIVRGYSSKRKYRRWPCHVFFTLLDCSIYASYLLWKASTGEKESHFEFERTCLRTGAALGPQQVLDDKTEAQCPRGHEIGWNRSSLPAAISSAKWVWPMRVLPAREGQEDENLLCEMWRAHLY